MAAQMRPTLPEISASVRRVRSFARCSSAMDSPAAAAMSSIWRDVTKG